MKMRTMAIIFIVIGFCFIFTSCAIEPTKTSQIDNSEQADNTVQINSSEQSNSTVQANNTEQANGTEQSPGTVQSKENKYIDGIYEGKSNLTSESYYGKAKVTIKNGGISSIDFEIYDSSRFNVGDTPEKRDEGMLLDENYSASIFAGTPEYQKQTTNELSGMKKYKLELLQEQDVDKVDAISGATWSHKIFQETLKTTLEQALK